MNEVYDAANNSVMLLIWMVQGYCLQYFYGSFLEGRGQGKTGNRLCVAAFYVALKLWLSLCLPSEYGDRRTIETHFITFLGLVAAALFFYQAVKAVTGFLVITFMAVCEIGVFGACIVGEIFDSVMDFWNWCMGKGLVHRAHRTFFPACAGRGKSADLFAVANLHLYNKWGNLQSITIAAFDYSGNFAVMPGIYFKRCQAVSGYD